jgi:hypothetical protein
MTIAAPGGRDSVVDDYDYLGARLRELTDDRWSCEHYPALTITACLKTTSACHADCPRKAKKQRDTAYQGEFC